MLVEMDQGEAERAAPRNRQFRLNAIRAVVMVSWAIASGRDVVAVIE